MLLNHNEHLVHRLIAQRGGNGRQESGAFKLTEFFKDLGYVLKCSTPDTRDTCSVSFSERPEEYNDLLVEVYFQEVDATPAMRAVMQEYVAWAWVDDIFYAVQEWIPMADESGLSSLDVWNLYDSSGIRDLFGDTSTKHNVGYPRGEECRVFDWGWRVGRDSMVVVKDGVASKVRYATRMNEEEGHHPAR